MEGKKSDKEKELEQRKKEDAQQPGGKSQGQNVAKKVNKEKSNTNTEEQVKNKVTGAELDAPPE
jgi:hypothetical protein